MGLLRNLQTSFAYRLRPTQFAAWIDAVSDFIDNFAGGGGSQAQTRYVSVLGSDATGDGSIDKPYLTIGKAMTSITDADPITKPYRVLLTPGVFPSAFTVKNGVYVVGAGSGSGNYNGGPQTGVSIVAPHTVQVLDATWQGAGEKSGGIINCTFSTDIQADFLALAVTGNCSFLLDDIFTDNDVFFIGATANGNTWATIRSLYQNGSGSNNLLLQNMGGSAITDYVSDFGGNITYTQSFAFPSFHTLSGSNTSGLLTCTWTSAALANNLSIEILNQFTARNPVVTGNGASIFAPGVVISYAMSDAANQLSFGATAAATMIGLIGGRNIINATPTAARVLTINAPTGRDTEVVVVNKATAFPIDLTLVGGTITPGSPTYVPPSSEVSLHFNATANTWTVAPYVQSGTATLTNGVSAAKIVADITANSRIVATWKLSNGAAGVPYAPAAGRTIGTRAGGGGFLLHSAALATGADVATDNGTYEWHIDNSGG